MIRRVVVIEAGGQPTDISRQYVRFNRMHRSTRRRSFRRDRADFRKLYPVPNAPRQSQQSSERRQRYWLRRKFAPRAALRQHIGKFTVAKGWFERDLFRFGI